MTDQQPPRPLREVLDEKFAAERGNAEVPAAPGRYDPRDVFVVPALPMPDLVTYVCAEMGCGAVFSHAEPFEAHGQYLDHLTEHDPIEDDPAGDRYQFPDRTAPLDPDPLTPSELVEAEDKHARWLDTGSGPGWPPEVPD